MIHSLDMPSFAGFDTGSYPGDDKMTAWSGGNSPYQFVGFYLDAPCHTRHTYTPWAGKYQFLTGLGWGLIVIYFGRQQTGCGSNSLSRAQGETDGADTIAKCNAEGFPPGTIVYIDVEHFDGNMSQAMSDYYRGWLSAILKSGTLQPGTYVARANVQSVLAAAQAEYAAQGVAGAPSLWVVKTDPNFDVASSDPAGCGIASADVWQGRLDHTNEAHNGFTIATVDQNVATSADPSRTLAAAAGTTVSD